MPYMGLLEIFHLPNIYQDAVHLSDQVNCDPLEMLHLRCGPVSQSQLLEAHRHMLFIGLPCKHLSKQFTKSASGH